MPIVPHLPSHEQVRKNLNRPLISVRLVVRMCVAPDELASSRYVLIADVDILVSQPTEPIWSGFDDLEQACRYITKSILANKQGALVS